MDIRQVVFWILTMLFTGVAALLFFLIKKIYDKVSDTFSDMIIALNNLKNEVIGLGYSRDAMKEDIDEIKKDIEEIRNDIKFINQNI